MHPHPSIHLPPHPHPPSKRQARTHAHTRGPADRPTPHPSVSQSPRQSDGANKVPPCEAGRAMAILRLTLCSWLRAPGGPANPTSMRILLPGARGPGDGGRRTTLAQRAIHPPIEHQQPGIWGCGRAPRPGRRRRGTGGLVVVVVGKAKRERRKKAEELRHHPKDIQLVSRRSDMRQPDRQTTTHNPPQQATPARPDQGRFRPRLPKIPPAKHPTSSFWPVPSPLPRPETPQRGSQRGRGAAWPPPDVAAVGLAANYVRNWAMGGTPPRSAAGSRPGRVIARRATQ